MFLRELVTLPASQHCATIRINLNLQLRVANQTILSTFRARSVSRPIVPSLRTCKSRKKDKTSDSFRNQNNLCICIYICIKYSEIIKIKYCHRDERYETTVLFLLFDRTVSLRHWLRKTCSYRARGEPFNDGTHNGLSVQWRIPLLFSLLGLPSSLLSTLSGNKKFTPSPSHKPPPPPPPFLFYFFLKNGRPSLNFF